MYKSKEKEGKVASGGGMELWSGGKMEWWQTTKHRFSGVVILRMEEWGGGVMEYWANPPDIEAGRRSIGRIKF